jgi:hypothetical protein
MEKMNNLKNVMHNSEQVSPDLFYISADDFNWLIKQAEKVKDLEKEIKRLQAFTENLQVVHFTEIQREKSTVKQYETALKFGVKYLQNSDSRQVQLVRNALKEALEDNA